MKLAVITNEVLKKAFLLKEMPAATELVFINDLKALPADADAVFDLLFEDNAERISVLLEFLPKPVFINAVSFTLKEINAPFIRLNAWPGFLQRGITEFAALPAQQPIAEHIFKQLGWRYQQVPDTTGMISARVVAMIVNEAYFTFGDGVSSKEEIDIAMKLGTNYPYGPFEWSRIIGLHYIHELLLKLSEEDSRYEMAASLETELRRN